MTLGPSRFPRKGHEEMRITVLVFALGLLATSMGCFPFVAKSDQAAVDMAYMRMQDSIAKLEAAVDEKDSALALASIGPALKDVQEYGAQLKELRENGYSWWQIIGSSLSSVVLSFLGINQFRDRKYVVANVSATP